MFRCRPFTALALTALAVTGAALTAPRAHASEREAWTRPVGGAVLRPFATVANPYAPGQHRGADLAAPVGTPVRSACSGRVRFAGTVADAGRTVSVRCGPLVASYLHLSSIAVRRGVPVVRGVVIGATGRSGAPRGRRPHLHLGAREVATGRYVDPLGLLGEEPPALPPVPAVPRLGPAPLPRAAPVLRPLRAHRAVQQRVPAPGSVPRGIPWPAWLGFAALAAAVPLGALATVRRRSTGSLKRPCPSTSRPPSTT